MYDVFLKARACLEYEKFTHSLRKVAKKYNISKSSLARWLKDRKTLRKKKTKRDHDKRLRSVRSYIDNIISKNPFASLLSIHKTLEKDHGLKRSPSTIFRDLKKLKITRKRTSVKSYAPERTLNYDYKTLRDALKNKETISIDESCFYVSDCPRYGYASRGVKVQRFNNPYKNSKRTLSLLLAVSSQGVIGYEISERSFDANSFEEFIDNLNVKEGTYIVLDNVRFHKTRQVMNSFNSKKMIPIFIPPYSPQYNPIEIVFSIIKSQVRYKNTIKDFSRQNLKENLTYVLENNIKTKSFYHLFEHCADECLQKL